MDNRWYSFDLPLGWSLLALLVALALSWLLYSKKGVPWNKNVNIALGFLRLSAIFLLLILLLEPMLTLNLNRTEKPILVLGIDNSESIPMRMDSSQLREVTNRMLEDANYFEDDFQVEIRQFNDKTGTINYSEKTTDLSELIDKVRNEFEFENLVGMVLLSDGIHNQGISPQYRQWSFPIYTVGIGDTIPPRDISITKIRNNKVAYEGNQFPVTILLSQDGFTGTTTNLSVSKKGVIVHSESVTFDRQIKQIDLLLNATEKGFNRFTVSISPLEGESSNQNNESTFVVDVIDSQEKVLLVGAAPHPDITAIRQVLSKSSNYETTLYIRGLNEVPKEKDYDAIVYHGAFSRNIVTDFRAKGYWYILSQESIIANVNKSLSFIDINPQGNERDLVRPGFNTNFTTYNVDKDLDKAADYPPVSVPYGEFTINAPVNILAYQQVGSVKTDKPLMLLYDDGSEKAALTMGTGLWKWRLQEAGFNESSDLFDEIITKTIQYLCLTENKKQFIATPRKRTYNRGEQVLVDTEVYNDLFERSFGKTISLQLIDENGSSRRQEIVNSPTNNTVRLGRLNPGIYQYTANTEVGNRSFSESGEFIVKETSLEAIKLQADHDLLKSLSRNSGGDYVHFTSAQRLRSTIEKQDFKGIIHTDRTKFPLINSLWYFAAIMLLLGSEWFLRKFYGGV